MDDATAKRREFVDRGVDRGAVDRSAIADGTALAHVEPGAGIHPRAGSDASAGSCPVRERGKPLPRQGERRPEPSARAQQVAA